MPCDNETDHKLLEDTFILHARYRQSFQACLRTKVIAAKTMYM